MKLSQYSKEDLSGLFGYLALQVCNVLEKKAHDKREMVKKIRNAAYDQITDIDIIEDEEVSVVFNINVTIDITADRIKDLINPI
jgi:hypothetical protein